MLNCGFGFASGVMDVHSQRESSTVLVYDFKSGRFMRGGNVVQEADIIPTSRATDAYATAANGILIEFPPNTPRRTNSGLEVEPNATNLMLWSDDFSKSVWALILGASVDGQVVTFSATDNSRFEQAVYGFTVGETYTFSCKCRLVSGEHTLRFRAQNTDFSDVTLSTDWAVVTHTFVAENTTQFPRISNHTNLDGIEIECEYFQLEKSSQASSYIPTTSASATRAADNIRCDGIAEVLAGMTRGVFVLDFNLDQVPANPNWQDIIICSKTGSSSHNFRMEISPVGQLRMYLQVGTVAEHKKHTVLSLPPLLGRYKVVLFADDNGAFKTCVNGGPVDSQNITSPNFLSQLEEVRFGAFFSPTFTFLSVLDEDPTNARLQELSAL